MGVVFTVQRTVTLGVFCTEQTGVNITWGCYLGFHDLLHLKLELQSITTKNLKVALGTVTVGQSNLCPFWVQ